MVRNLILFLVIVGFVFSNGQTPISSCQAIANPGEYVLTADLTGIAFGYDYCIRIQNPGIVLDCDGHTITGTDTGYGISFKSDNITVKNCNISNYDTAIHGSPSSDSSILNNELYGSNYNNLGLYGSYNNIEGNLIHHSDKGSDGAALGGDYNTIIGNEFYKNGHAGMSIKGYYNELDDNTAYYNGGSGFFIGGNSNVVTGNTAYKNDWDPEIGYEGAGFEFGKATGDVIDGNTAYGNTNGFYIEGRIPKPSEPLVRADPPTVFGNTFTNNHAYDNLVGLNFLDNNGTYTDNTLEENYEADMLIAGDLWIGSAVSTYLPPPPPALGSDVLRLSIMDWTLMCDNTVEDNTGSGGRPIYYSGETVTLSGGTYSEVLLCNATDSVITGVTVDGSNTLDNNGMILLFSNGTTITDSTSQDNFMGFGFVRTPDATLSNSNSDGSGFGVFSLQSMDLTITKLTSDNNKMNATIILDILMGFFEGTARGEPMRSDAPPPEIHELGAGALLVQSPRATITDSTFSGSTFGLALFMSDEATINGGHASNNDVFGYGLLDSYNVNFEGGAAAYDNAGNIHDIFVDTIPEQYEMLEFLPFGVGVMDISLEMILGPLTARGEPLRALTGCGWYSQCDLSEGMICNLTSHECEVGTFENVFSSMRIYDNHYGLVLFNLGHEVVENSRVYENHVLGILDASDTNPPVPFGFTPVVVNADAVTISNSYFHKNGEEIFATLGDLFEEGERPQWAEAFYLFDEIFGGDGEAEGVIELEIIEASYFHWMDMPLAAIMMYPHWELNQVTVGTGAPSVMMSLDDNATAIYLISDTTLPTLDSFHIESEDLGVNMTIYLDINDAFIGPRVSYNNKYFMIAALNEQAPTSADVGHAIDEFVVHYGGGYDPETMGLYYLNIREFGQYCEEDLDCPGALRDVPEQACWENMCVDVECRSNDDCPPDMGALVGPDYCVGYQCVYCRDDADCTGGEDCERCLNGKCKQNRCLADIDCLEGCECSGEETGYGQCSFPTLASADGSCGTAPIDDYVILRAVVEEEEIIMKAVWFPVRGQINNETDGTITVYDLSQKDRTAFIEELLGGLPIAADPEFNIYFDIYGLFAVRGPVQPGDGDGKQDDYVCERDVDCPECYYCSLANNACLPKTEGIECGVPGTGCPEGYECESCECIKVEEPLECTSNRECLGNEYCDDNGDCVLVECECGEVKDHECFPFDCCSNADCREGYECKDNKCVDAEEDEECDECEDPIRKTEDLIEDANEQGIDTSVIDELLGKAKEAKEDGDCEEALRYANAALAAAEDLLAEEDEFPVPIISTEVPSVEAPQLPNGKEVTEWQQGIFWIILIILGLALVGYWYFRSRHRK